jgi:pilus assembly protein CpaB
MKRPVIFVALAGLAAMLASIVVYSALKKREADVQKAMARTIYIVVAASDLPLGTKLDPGQLKLARWSADAIPDGAFMNPSQVTGAFVKNQFVTNEPIVATKLFLGQKTAGVMPLLIPPGMRAVSVQVDEVSDISGFVLPHAHVDILVAVANQGGGGGSGDKPFSKIVLQNVEVLAVAQEVEKKKDEPELVKVVTVLVTPQDAERLALATREGVLHLAMRNYADSKIVLTSGTNVEELLHQYSLNSAPIMPIQHAVSATPTYRPASKFQVEIYRDGKSSESVSFVREALADTGHKHSAGAAAGESYSAVERQDHNSDEGTISDHSASKDDGALSNASNSHGPTLPPTDTVSADQSASFAPKGKTIDIP